MILDNSISMQEQHTGTPYQEVKKVVMSSLGVIPNNNEVGLRVFEPGGSRLVADYSTNRGTLERRLAGVQPEEATFIGQSLIDAANDLARFTAGSIRLFLITDGAGDEVDIALAGKARNDLLAGRSDFECTFIVFNQDADSLADSLISRTADALGCDFKTPGTLSAQALRSSLTQAFTFSFFPVWLLISGILYFILVALTSSMVFDSHIKTGNSPRAAMTWSGVFLVSMWVLIITAHTLSLFDEVGFGAMALLGGLAILATVGSAFFSSRKMPGGDIDPF